MELIINSLQLITLSQMDGRTREQRGDRALKKYIYSSSVKWHLWLPLIQLGLNTRFLARMKSTPFAVMFEREFNDFDDFKNIAFAMEITEAMEKRGILEGV